MIKGAIFDVDGTLLDSMGVWDTIGEDYLRSLGYEPRENLNEKFRIMSIPCMLFFKDGQLVDRLVGAQPKAAIAAKLDSLL